MLRAPEITPMKAAPVSILKFIDRSLRAAEPLVSHAPHGQVDGRSSHPARLVGRHEDRHVCHLLERHDPSRVSPVCEVILELFPGHARCLGLELEELLYHGCLRHAVWSQTEDADALRCEFGG